MLAPRSLAPQLKYQQHLTFDSAGLIIITSIHRSRRRNEQVFSIGIAHKGSGKPLGYCHSYRDSSKGMRYSIVVYDVFGMDWRLFERPSCGIQFVSRDFAYFWSSLVIYKHKPISIYTTLILNTVIDASLTSLSSYHYRRCYPPPHVLGGSPAVALLLLQQCQQMKRLDMLLVLKSTF